MLLEGHKDIVRVIKELPGNCLVSASNDNDIKFWNTKTGKVIATIGNTDNPTSMCLTGFNELAVGSFDGKIRVYDLNLKLKAKKFELGGDSA